MTRRSRTGFIPIVWQAIDWGGEDDRHRQCNFESLKKYKEMLKN